MASGVNPRVIRVTIFDVYPTQLGHCPHYNLVSSQMMTAGSEFCELSSQAVEYPEEVIGSHGRAVRILEAIRREVGGEPVRVEVEMVELLSPRGFISSLRYGIRSNFAVVINGRKVYDGRPEEGVVEERVAAHVRELLRT
ncbi:MAG: hypothetical protein QXO17_02085 [Nitrososphaerota archaeon]|nr:hypothetical protein [Candidatus Calditenuis fumarioli]